MLKFLSRDRANLFWLILEMCLVGDINVLDIATVTNLFQSVNVWLEEVSQTLSKCCQSVCEWASLVSGNVRKTFSKNVGQTSDKVMVELIDNQVVCSWSRWQAVLFYTVGLIKD